MNLNLLIFTLACYVFLGAAHDGDIPVCADACFAAGISKSGCAADDLLCQCTTKNDFISSFVTTCLFENHPCSTTDLARAYPRCPAAENAAYAVLTSQAEVQGAASKLCAKARASASAASAATATPTPPATANDTSSTTTSTAESSTTAIDGPTPAATSSSAPALTNDTGPGSLSTGAKAGIGVGAGSIALSAALLFWLRWRRRRHRPKNAYPLSESESTEQFTTGSEPPELKLLELGAFDKPMEFEVLERPVELEARERPLELRDTSHIAEMPG